MRPKPASSFTAWRGIRTRFFTLNGPAATSPVNSSLCNHPHLVRVQCWPVGSGRLGCRRARIPWRAPWSVGELPLRETEETPTVLLMLLALAATHAQADLVQKV